MPKDAHLPRAKDRWSYADFGPPFAEKYALLRAFAAERGVIPNNKNKSWAETEIATEMKLNSQQWSNLRWTKTAPVGPVIHAYQLATLARQFRLNEVFGEDVWRQFLPDVSVEAFAAKLRRPSEIPELERYVLKCPATLKEYDATVDITNATFSDDVIDLEADRIAFEQNPYSMVVLVDLWQERVLGWVDIYYLPPARFEQMLGAGEVEINPSELMDFPESCHATRGYTASITLLPDRYKLARFLVYGMMDFLLKFQFFGTDRFELFAVAATAKGKNLLQTLEFDLVREVQMDVGPCGLYSRSFQKHELEHEKQKFARRYGVTDKNIRLEIENPYIAPGGNSQPFMQMG